MTIYEHAMIGINGTLALGLNRRCGWAIVALAGTAALLPDCDGLAILFGLQAYAEGHRVWCHNLLAAGVAAVGVSAAAYYFDIFQKIQRRTAKHCTTPAVGDETVANVSRPHRAGELLLWIGVGVAAATSHLLADVIFSAGSNQPIWSVPLWWPFSDRVAAYPLLPWGDIGVTLIFAVSMFAMLRWQKRIQLIAIASLVLAAIYIAVRGFLLP